VRVDAGQGLLRHSPNCLACGDENPSTMGLRMWRVGDEVHGEVTLPPVLEGAPGIAHGGITAAVLDDVLGTQAMLGAETMSVTVHLEVDYYRPVRLGRRLTLRGRTIQIDGRKVSVAAELHDDDGLLAEGRGLFLCVPPEHFIAGVA
jgi:uncharacterized protein (TIGR00369 family)